MNFETQETEEEQVLAALKHFRESVHGWSDLEYARPRAVKDSRWSPVWRAISGRMMAPAMGWALAAVLAIGGVGIPAGVHHRRQVAAALAAEREQQRIEALDAERQAMARVDDDELLSHVESDIAQGTPDAMEPLASLMNDDGEK